MIKKIIEGVWKIKSDANIYFLDFDKKIIIDTGKRSDRHNIEMLLKHVISPENIDIVIITHLHYDHTGNIDLFSNAKVYASQETIDEFNNNPFGSVLDEETVERLNNITLNPLPLRFEELDIINTPGHTKGSICIWYDKRKILFSGDTLFDKRQFGRTDLPTSEPDMLMQSIIKLARYHYEYLCPGHDY
jgi:glyoxylase-like metal-dependent hydrolase (beta-lactamase superfamily II)